MSSNNVIFSSWFTTTATWTTRATRIIFHLWLFLYHLFFRDILFFRTTCIKFITNPSFSTWLPSLSLLPLLNLLSFFIIILQNMLGFLEGSFLIRPLGWYFIFLITKLILIWKIKSLILVALRSQVLILRIIHCYCYISSTYILVLLIYSLDNTILHSERNIIY